MKYYSAIKKNAFESVPKRYTNLAHDIKVTILMICVQYSSVKYTHIAVQPTAKIISYCKTETLYLFNNNPLFSPLSISWKLPFYFFFNKFAYSR